MANPLRKYIETNSLRRDAEDVTRLTKQYVIEETVDPLKRLGRYAAFGCLGSALVGLGTLLLLTGVLRILQTETSVFHGNLSWIPYFIVVAAAMAVLALVGWRIVSGPAKRRLSKKDS